ncbi:MAG: hypothetical protein GOMPHAMPRED_006321 [Gomphillus americanus]|uniref:Mitochondrial import inner membrane translocase subunit TIM23 n=1 Tax=Gomphillus americanus TaxID=1940652 RepID=A0A8H3ETW7_9LECA|nr:MAG: hypothetical protein GOMPHAMPRED_006321 [Gomphillus americanus]
MAIWDTLMGKSSSNSSTSTPSTPSQSSESLQDLAPTTRFESAPAIHPEDIPSSTTPPPSIQLYNPATLHPLAGLGQSGLDYLTLEDSALSNLPGAQSGLPSRGWSDDLCYGTGITYVTALGMGGAWGLVEGLNRSPANAPPKLRLNSALNSITRRGPFLGNSAGVLALVYNIINSTIGHYRGKHDVVNSLTAGALSGMLFKSTRGVRPMAISGGLVAGAAGTWTLAKKALV